MLELYYWPTPNGHKVSIFLEEAGLPYEIKPVNILAGDQFKREFLKISPNNRMPAIIDLDPPGGGEPISVFESGAILMYLAEKHGRFLPADLRGRYNVLQWLFWQVGGLGPMAGQNHHFARSAPERLDYAINRYVNETGRLYAVLNKQLAGRDFITGEYSIADMACYPWTLHWEMQSQKLEDFPHLAKWMERIKAQPAVIAAYAKGEALRSASAPPTEEQKKMLYGQSAQTVR